jgi:membrane protein implicated in regulation of membrane protease activity
VDGATLVFMLVGASGAAILLLGVIGSGLLGLIGFGRVGGASAETVAAFVGAFGFAAAIASELLGARTPGGVAAAGAIGLSAAVPIAFLAVRLSRWARDIPTDATPGRADLVGAIGVVVTPISQQGYGEVRVRVAGQPVKLHARAGWALPLGTEVFVVEATSHSSVVVEPLLSAR